MITPRQLDAFRAVIQTRSMTKAGDLLRLTQPAVSKLIGDLEATVGFQLFERKRGGLAPTSKALSFFSEVERYFVGMERINWVAGEVRKGRRGQLRISASPALTNWFLPQVIAEFVREHGPMAIAMDSANAPDDVEMVAAKQAELGFAMLPVDASRVDIAGVYSLPCVCILPPGHRLTSERVISLASLRGESFISLESGTTTRLRIDAAFAAANVTRVLELEARWAASVSGLVAAGLGLSVIDPLSAHSFRLQGGAVRPLSETIAFSFAAILPKTGRQEHAVAFLDAHSRIFEGLEGELNQALHDDG
jgi:DNA-binding transcriptional LysR family regulator